jgi:hypothetical protein
MLAVVLVLATTLVACGSSDAAATSPVDPGTSTPADDVCAEGFAALEGGAGCGPVLPTEPCAAGTRAALGERSCVAVGVTACATGFVTDPSGWGCAPVIAPTACATGSGTRERLGTTSCVPVSDCGAPFPPPAATIFVDAAFTDAQVDATHFRSIADAVGAAPAGATIAVDAGTYVEKVALKHRAVKIIGRCSDKVVMKQATGVLGSAIEAASGDDFLLENITLRGYNAAIAVLGGKATLHSLVIEDGLLAGVVAGNAGTDVHLTNVVVRGMKPRAGASEAFGVFASAGAIVTIEDSVFSGNDYANVGVTKLDTTLTLSRSIVRDGRPLGVTRAFGIGVYTAESASVTVEESAIVDNSAAGLDVFSLPGQTSAGTLRRSVVRGTKRDGANKAARGLDVTGSHVVVEGSTIGANVEMEVVVAAGAALEISDSTLLGAAPTSATERGATGLMIDGATVKARSLAIVSTRAGVEVLSTGKADLAGSLVKGTRTAATFYEKGHYTGPGLIVESKASLVLSGSTVEDTHTSALAVRGTADISGSLVRGTRAGDDGLYGRGMSVQSGGKATVTRSAFADQVESGILVSQAGASLTMTDSTIQGTGFDANGGFGIGLLFGGDVTGAVDRCTITGSKGIGVAVSAAGAFLHHTTVSRNAVGLHAQDGTALVEGESAGDARAFVVSTDTRLVENQTRVGSGIVALPNVLDLAGP